MQTIYLDISNKGVIPTVYAKQEDVGRKFRVVFTNSGVPYNVETAIFSVWYEGDSGSGNYTKIGEKSAFEIDGNCVVVEMIAQMLSVSGDGVLCLVLSDAKQKIGSWNIPYICEEKPGADSNEATEYYTAFSEIVDAAKKFTTDTTLSVSGRPADAAETGRQLSVERARIDNIIALPEGSTTGDAELLDLRIGVDGKTYPLAGDAVRGQIGNLNNTLSEVTKSFVVSDNKFDGVFDESGYIEGNADKESGMFKRTSKFYDLPGNKPYLHISLTEKTGTFTVVLYDENKSYVGIATCNNMTFASISIPTNAVYFRVYAYSSFNGEAYVSTVYPNGEVNYEYKCGALLDAEKLSPSIVEKLQQVDEQVEKLSADVEIVSKSITNYNDVFIFKTVSYNMFDGVFDESGYIEGNTDKDSTMFKRTSKYYEIGEHNELIYIALSETTGTFAVVLYDKNKNYLTTANCVNALSLSAKIYPQSAFFRVYTYSSFNGSAYVSGTKPSNPVDFIGERKTFVNADKIEPPLTATIANTLKGKNITCFGDSLAANCYTGSVKRWINRVGEYFQCAKIYNRGVGGSAVSSVGASGAERNNYASFNEAGEAYMLISYSADNVPAGIPSNYTQKKASMELDERVNTIPLDTDILLIEAGTNDNDLEVEALSAAYDRMLVKIQNRLPNAKIVIVGLPFTNPSIYMNDEMRIAFRKKLASLMVGIREVAKKYGIPVIEFKDTAQVNLINYTNYLSTDGLHYDTEAGTKRWAETVIRGLAGLSFL